MLPKNLLQNHIKIINKYNVQLLIPALDFELKLYSKYKDFIEKKQVVMF